jgi:UDP-N-acetylmuramoylalanine--D-glutamate ligase
VVGLGRSGVAAARLAAAGGALVTVTDQRDEGQLGAALSQLPGACQRALGGHPETCLDGVDLVVASPGVVASAPILEAARARSLEVLTEVEFAWMHRPDAPLAAVTGSNGKSTVTTLTAELLAASGVRVAAGGNLGTAASELVRTGGWDAWVLEVSSFQAELFTAMRPTVGVFLNLTQDHLERHPTLATYLAAKQRLFAHQLAADRAVLNADDPLVAAVATRARRLHFSLERPADGCLDGPWLTVGGERLLEVGELALAGRHNQANALAAALAARELGAAPEAMAGVLRVFAGLPHRHRTVHVEAGVRWVDDSKATNVGATLAGLGGYDESTVHLVLGGQAKGQDFGPLVPEVARAAVRVYVIGVDGDRIGDVLAGVVPVERCGRLEEAVTRARAHARPGQTVLLAPACASFDQFADYGARGDAFAALARGEDGRCR